jgi:hypothetical protein
VTRPVPKEAQAIDFAGPATARRLGRSAPVEPGLALCVMRLGMEPDHKELDTAKQIAGTPDQIAGQPAYLRKILIKLERTQELLRRASDAYRSSRELLL